MPTPDLDDERDERFEVNLRRFRPLAPERLQIERHARATRRSFVLAAWAASAAAILVVAVLGLQPRTGQTHSAPAVEGAVGTEQLVNTQPLTIRSANALLATAPSFKAAVDEMAVQPSATPLSKDQRSALDVLSKEKTKL